VRIEHGKVVAAGVPRGNREHPLGSVQAAPGMNTVLPRIRHASFHNLVLTRPSANGSRLGKIPGLNGGTDLIGKNYVNGGDHLGIFYCLLRTGT